MDTPVLAAQGARLSRQDVTITRVEVIPLAVPMVTPVKISSGAPRPSVDVLVVRLHTASGLTGIGETQAWRRRGSSETLASLMEVIGTHFTQLVVGRSAFDIASIMSSLEEAIHHSYYAQAPISDALFDLQGKLLGVPVYQLIGGRCRPGLPGCAVLFMKPTVEETVAGAQTMVSRGFRSFTVKVGVDPRADVALVKALRERFGDSVMLRCDANAGMQFDDAVALLRALEPYRIDAAEQLLDLWDVDGMAELARRFDVPMMADECVASDRDLVAVIRKRAASIVQTKVAKNGGLWHTRRLWELADSAAMRIYPGNHPATSIATMSVAHLGVAWPGELLEGPFAVGLESYAEDLVTEPVRFEGNVIPVRDTPGLGVTLDEEKIAKLRLDR